jgi:methyltransferase
MTEPSVAARMEQAVRTYIQACNDGDAPAIAACLHPEAVQYFPNIPKWVGSSLIGNKFATLVRERNLCWTVDQLAVDADRLVVALEFTGFDGAGRIFRGVEWYDFEPGSLLIREIRPYFAARSRDAVREELEDFDYAGRGYPMTRPA